MDCTDRNPVASGGHVRRRAGKPLEHFIEAKDAFDRLETSKMTQDQRSYYYATQQSVDSTELGIILKVIEFVGESGLLE